MKTFLFLCFTLLAAAGQAQDVAREVFRTEDDLLILSLEPDTFGIVRGNSTVSLVMFRVKINTGHEVIEKDAVWLEDPSGLGFTFGESFKNDKINVLILKGRQNFYVYDILNRRLSPSLKPNYWGIANDAQSGSVSELKISHNGEYLYGYSLDNGPFLFNLCNPSDPKEQMAVSRPFMGETRLFTLENCLKKGSFSGILLIRQDGVLENKLLFLQKKLIGCEPANRIEAGDEESTQYEESQVPLHERRYVFFEEQVGENKQYLVVDMFLGDIVEDDFIQPHVTKEEILQRLLKK